MRRALLLLLLFPLVSCATVDETEYCVKTRFGEVVDQQMARGLVGTWLIYEVTCFDMTDQSFPDGRDEAEVEVIQAQTSDPVSLNAELQVIWRYDPETIYQIFLEKRQEAAVELEIRGAIRSGARNALNSFTIDEVFSDQRERVESAVEEAIQRSVGNRAIIVNAFLRNLQAPQAIEQARIAATRQEQRLQEARRQFQIDSVDAEATRVTAEAEAYRREVEAVAYNSNPELLQLRTAEAMANGLAQACGNAQTCIIGGNVVDRFLAAQ